MAETAKNVPCRKRMAGRRSSSIGCRSLIGRRTSVYVNSYDPIKCPVKFSPITKWTTKSIYLIIEINGQVALFRDLLIHIGQTRDCPELREKIRKLRRNCVEACKHTSQLILPQLRSAVAEGIPADNPHLVLLFFMSQLFLRELTKCHRLVQIIPMDMSGYYDNRAGPSNLGNVISQILLCKQITPDFNQEELCSITKDSQEITKILKEMQEYMPKQENNLEKSAALTEDLTNQWTNKHRRNSLYKHMGLLCCVSRPNYL